MEEGEACEITACKVGFQVYKIKLESTYSSSYTHGEKELEGYSPIGDNALPRVNGTVNKFFIILLCKVLTNTWHRG